MADIILKYYRLDPKKIVLLKSLLEGHEGLIVVRTADPKKGIIQLMISPDFLNEVDQIIADLSRQIWMEKVDYQANESSS